MNITRIANSPGNLVGRRNGRRPVLLARALARSRVGYSAVGGLGVALVLVLTLIYPAGGENWPLAAVALCLLFGGMIAHAVLTEKVRTTEREARALEQRLSAEASASRVLDGIKLLNSAGSQAGSDGDSLGTDARLAAAARMATGYAAAIVFNLRDSHGVFVPSSWSYEGQLARSGDEFEPVDGQTPGAMAARLGAAIVLSLTDVRCADLPRWAEQAGFIQGIVVPIVRGLDTVGIVYVFSKSVAVPTLNEVEQLELTVSFASNYSVAPGLVGNGIVGNSMSAAGAGPGTAVQPFRIPESRSERRTSVTTGINMPGFALDPELERMELDGISLSLSPTEFMLVHTLASSPGRPVSAGELVSACWAGGSRPADNALDVAIFRLRRKLRKTASGNGLITTVRGSGYMFVPPTLNDPVLAAAD